MKAAVHTIGLAVLAWALPDIAEAHTGVGYAGGFAHGLMHPLLGIDHVLAMVAAGLIAANLGGRALWAVPLSFVSLMMVGGGLGVAGIGIPHVELGIALSVTVFGAAVALRRPWPVPAAMALVSAFAVFHGHAHGAEMPESVSVATYALGFILATGILHGVGLTLGLGIVWIGASRGLRAAQATGASVGLVGVGLLIGAM